MSAFKSKGTLVVNGASYSGGGGSGSSDYTELDNKPQINGVTLDGNKSTSDLGIDVPEVSVTQILSEGTKIATVKVDDTETDLCAPAGGRV